MRRIIHFRVRSLHISYALFGSGCACVACNGNAQLQSNNVLVTGQRSEPVEKVRFLTLTKHLAVKESTPLDGFSSQV